MMKQYCHFVKGFSHALKQLFDILNMLCELMQAAVSVTFVNFALQRKQLFDYLNVYLSSCLFNQVLFWILTAIVLLLDRIF